MKEKLSEFLNKQNIELKSLGIYLAVILVIFLLCLPIIETNLNKRTNETVKSEISVLTAKANKMKEDRTQSIKNSLQKQNDTIISNSQEKAVENNPVISKDNINNSKDYNSQVVQNEVEATISNQTEKDSSKNIEQKNQEEKEQVIRISDLKWPIGGQISWNYGLSYSKTFDDYRFHNGLDIKGNVGDIVNSALNGKVVEIQDTRSEGIIIIIDHGSNWATLYSHLGKSTVNVGDIVKTGDKVGSLGEPGYIESKEGVHLHFALTEKGQFVNPIDYLPKRK